MKKCFTINPLRTTEEILSYYTLFENNIYQAIEIFYPYRLVQEKQTVYMENILNLKNTFSNIEIVLHLPHGSVNLCNLENYLNVIKLMKEAMAFANIMGARKLTLHLGYANNRERKQDINHIVKVLKDLCLFAKDFNMVLMIENMPGVKEIGYSPKEILEIIKKVRFKNLKFILDTGHANLSDYDINDYIHILKKHLYHLHFNDNQGVKDEHNRLGSGSINFYEVIEALKDIDYQELICLEILYNNVSDLIRNANDLNQYF